MKTFLCFSVAKIAKSEQTQQITLQRINIRHFVRPNKLNVCFFLSLSIYIYLFMRSIHKTMPFLFSFSLVFISVFNDIYVFSVFVFLFAHLWWKSPQPLSVCCCFSDCHISAYSQVSRVAHIEHCIKIRFTFFASLTINPCMEMIYNDEWEYRKNKKNAKITEDWSNG